MTLSAVQNPSLSGVGIAIQGGLPRSKVVTDPMARTGSMAIASQCPEGGYMGYPSALAIVQGDEQVPAIGSLAPNQTAAVTMPPTYYRQDVFALGQAIRARLVKLRELADYPGSQSPATSVDAQARGAAVAEIGAWAGAGRMILSTDLGDTASSTVPVQHIYLDFLGVEPADFGVHSLQTDLPGAIKLIYNDATLAECAANLRSCDPHQLANHTWANDGTVGTPLPAPAGGYTVRSRFGMTDQQARLTFPMASAPGFDWHQGFSFPVYIVASQDPSKPPGIGEVLGVMRLPVAVNPGQGGGYETWESSLTLSPMRRELVYDAFGLGKWVGAVPPQAGELPLAGPPTFCIDRVPRDVFVPLQNDLTDSSDSYENSWQHYLSLAQEAATNADTIGQQLIDIGYQQDVNIENAADQVLTETGNPLNVSDLSVDANGNINAGPSNGALAQIINQPTFDVVFFGKNPASGNTKKELESALGCATTPTSWPCSKLSQAAGPPNYVKATDAVSITAPNASGTFTYTALNLVSPKSDSDYQPACAQLVNGAAQMNGNAAGLFDPSTFATAQPIHRRSEPKSNGALAGGLLRASHYGLGRRGHLAGLS
jgi:hypothetical protein